MKIIDVAIVCNIFVCCVVVVQINHDGAMLRFIGGFFVFATERSGFGDGSVLKVVGSLQ